MKSGIIGVVGRTNAGKSTLVNRILGEKVSIVSPVAQTTRAVIRGVLTDERGQLVLLDTPGLHKSRNLLTSTMNKRARVASEGADAVLLVVDASVSPQLEDDGWMRRLAKSDVPVVIAFNKKDKGDKSAEFKLLWDEIRSSGVRESESSEVQWHNISATTGAGVDALVSALFSLLPVGEPLFDTETLSDYPRKLAIADIIRERFFLVLKDELPHSIGIIVESISDTSDLMQIDATILVKRESHKGIVIGKGGKFIKDAQKSAAREITSAYGVRATVSLRVKVVPDWDENPTVLGQMGF
ncbi:MAG: GTPase Era [Kiritimatiellaeota bacterium]|nr:GTPase Era [Kiritimatiellota bacterium]